MIHGAEGNMQHGDHTSHYLLISFIFFSYCGLFYRRL